MTDIRTIDTRIATRRAELAKQRAERKDELDLPRTLTMRQVNAELAVTAQIDKMIAAFETTVETWAALQPLDADTKWIADANAWREIIDAELLAMPPRIRNERELATQQRLKWSIKLIEGGFAIAPPSMPIVDLSSTRVGELMQAAGYAVSGEALRGPRGFRGSIKEVEARITAITKQRAAAEAALNAALLTDDERAKREVESDARRAVLDSLHLRINSDGTGYVARDDYGDVRDLATLTPIERTAFDRADAAYRQEQQDTFDRQSGRPREAVTTS